MQSYRALQQINKIMKRNLYFLQAIMLKVNQLYNLIEVLNYIKKSL